ncbi:unnamed protein product [Chilo suppressalis]|uniref:Uncharacterized protein n=1 Tax=Chilo suppressalis TaxID=168631 RepID=A0ABN8B3Y3_CHISP|nr:unnamed protein product [Chilo suppressalis]
MKKNQDSFFLPKKTDKNDKQNKKNKKFDDKRKEQFNKSRGVEEKSENTDKKPFDKKTYRLKKYSKKYKLEQWEEQRKKKLLRDYYKEVKNDPVVGSYKPKNFDEDATDSVEVGRFVKHPDLLEKENQIRHAKKDPFHKAKEHYKKIKEEKLQKQQEIEKAKEEKQKKLQEYKKKKQERFKKLSKKTKKGQPVMTGRLELLLEKIQNNSN